MPVSGLVNESNEVVYHPFDELKKLSADWNLDIYSEEFSIEVDKKNIWPSYRSKFYYPKFKELPKVDLSKISNPEEECIYLCGNSLGLQPRPCREYVEREFDKWAKMGVYGHREGEMGWAWCEEPLRPAMARLVGGSVNEVALMNFLSINIHLMMVSFYQPTEKRFKILIEDKAFPSDHYIVESQIRLHNLDPKDCMILVKPREGETSFRTEDILEVIEKNGEQLALVFLSGVQYFTGQLFDIQKITEAAHRQGSYAGWDLAHAVGNVELKLHDWNVDFAAWCTYKYLNSGAGSIGGVFLHENHFENISKFKKFDGWWGHKFSSRFKMSNVMEYAEGVSAYYISNGSMLLTSCLKASLDIFDEANIYELRKKSKILTSYLEGLIRNCISKKEKLEIKSLTPTDFEQRGAQLSIEFSRDVNLVHEELEKRGVVCDFREPNVLRFAPAPLYNNFNDVYRFANVLNECLDIVYYSEN